MRSATAAGEGLRERKRRETLGRITDVSIGLFSKVGYDATTFDDIAAAAGISRRTLFNYFDSKDAILFAHLRGYYQMIADSIAQSSPDEPPLDVARSALIQSLARLSTERIVQVANIIRRNEALRNRVRANDANLEGAILEGLHQLWPEAEAAPRMALVAMLCAGAMRLAVADWLRDGATASLATYAATVFDAMNREFADASPRASA